MSRSVYRRWKQRRAGPGAITRRELLRSAAAGAVGLLVARCGAAPPAAVAPAKRRVVVIGAGFAGLAAASELLAAGCVVVVVEARTRVGGRVVTLDDPARERCVEAGGELIGANHPHWLAYAQRFGFELAPTAEPDDAETPVVLEGRRLSGAEAGALFEEMDRCFEGVNVEAAKVDADEPWKSADAEALDRRSTADWIASLEVSDLCRRALAVELENDNGVAVARQSWLGFLAMVRGGGLADYWTESEVWRCRGGNQRLARALAEEVGLERLRLGVAATRIERDPAGGGARVALADGSELEADEVVLAIPPSVWPTIDFEPALPATLSPQMGIAVKHLCAMRQRFWRESSLAADGMSDGPLGFTWDATLGQAGNGAVMTGFSGGPAAEVCRGWSTVERDGKVLGELEALFPDVRRHFVHALFLDWPADPWVRGGYSFPAPGEVTAVGPTLRSGLGPLHFAGEHCCPGFVGYMEGALASGVAVATRIAARAATAAAG
jgi:monoamine oxidase